VGTDFPGIIIFTTMSCVDLGPKRVPIHKDFSYPSQDALPSHIPMHSCTTAMGFAFYFFYVNVFYQKSG